MNKHDETNLVALFELMTMPFMIMLHCSTVRLFEQLTENAAVIALIPALPDDVERVVQSAIETFPASGARILSDFVTAALVDNFYFVRRNAQ